MTSSPPAPLGRHRSQPFLSRCRRPWTGWAQIIAATFMTLSPLPTSLASWSDTDSDSYNDTWTDPNTSQVTTLADLNLQNNDADNDGATNDEEAAEGSNPFSLDTDYDGISDGDELHLVKPLIGASLTDWDSDDDEVSDYDEWYNFSGVTYPSGQLPNLSGASYSDYDGDGFKNPIDPFPTDPTNYSTINSTSWYGDALGDSDSDTTLNWQDAYPNDPNNLPNPDSDFDGIQDTSDPYPNDATNYSTTNGVTWYGDVFGDADSDGITNYLDPSPYPITDSDGDGFDDVYDPYPNDATNHSSVNGVTWYSNVLGDADSDSTPNWQDASPYPITDTDGDSIEDGSDPYPSDNTNYSTTNGISWYGNVLGDADSDGTPNWQDSSPYLPADDDSDGIPNDTDPFPSDNSNYSSSNYIAWYGDVLGDADGDGTPNYSDSYPHDPYNGFPPDPDYDGDGLTQSQEATYGTQDNDVDCDDDGLTDYEEKIVYNTNPLNAYHISQGLGWGDLYTDYALVDLTDSDGDGIPNRIEVLYGLLPNDSTDGRGDLDGNGMSNHTQYLAGLALNVDLNLYDNDLDGMTDIYEDYYQLNKYHFSDAVEDADNDGVLNAEEVVLMLSPRNPNTRGLSSGGLSPRRDLEVLMIAILYPEGGAPTADADSDGIADWMEEALLGASPRFVRIAGSDLDGDGMPDVWEHSYGRWKFPSLGLYLRHDDADDDPDEDGLTNLQEYDLGTNPVISDSNQNTVEDGAEDADGDGLANAQEYQHGTNPVVADTDGDGVSDGAEVAAGTDPLDTQSHGNSLGLRVFTELR